MVNIPGLGLPAPDDSTPIRIRTPHAAVIIWNYNERVGSVPSANVNAVDKLIISTVSCVSIQTSKSKGDPQGSFQLTLAPRRNWVSAITPGSWCVLLMSNSPLTEADFQKVDPNKLKMIGKIDTVRVDTEAGSEGERKTMYYVSGVDWGHVFNNILYIDSNLARPTDPINLGNSAAVAIQNLLFGEKGIPKRFTTAASINALLETFGKDLTGFSAAGGEINLLANAIYNFNMPQSMISYLALNNKNGFPVPPPTNVNSAINLISGALKTTEDSYTDTEESYGFIDPFSLQGAHSFWQVLIDNSNPTMNEMIAEMRPSASGTKLCLYNRIKPFAVRGSPYVTAVQAIPGAIKVASYFQNIKTHMLDSMTIKKVNAGTNWKDKYNFVEIKPQFQDERIMEAAIKTYTQAFDVTAFQREGFRPLIFSTKHFPGPVFEGPSLTAASWAELRGWVQMLQAWYFDTHKMLNGTIIMTGIDGYIAVGDNIQFDAQLINSNKNFNMNQKSLPLKTYVLAHVENVSHSFSVDPNSGARTYTTTIQFVRGLIVDEGKNPLTFDAGAIDVFASMNPDQMTANTDNVIISGSKETPKIN